MSRVCLEFDTRDAVYIEVSSGYGEITEDTECELSVCVNENLEIFLVDPSLPLNHGHICIGGINASGLDGIPIKYLSSKEEEK